MNSELIRDLVESEFRIDISEKNRKREFVYPRNIYFKLSRDFTDEGYESIGNNINRDHSTVMHGERVCKDVVLRFEPKYKERYIKLKKILNKICDTSDRYLDDNEDIEDLLLYKDKYKEALLETRVALNRERALRHKYKFLLGQMKKCGYKWADNKEFQI